MSESSFPAILTAIDVLNEHGSRVGRTHIHKFLFLAESWGLLPPAHRFSLYLHGPYSRDLDGELLALRAAGLVVASPDAAGYGAQYAVSPEHAQSARENLGDAAADPRLEIIAKTLAPMVVRALEAISTGEFILQQEPNASNDQVITAVRALKPHLGEEEVQRALSMLGELRETARVPF